MTTEVELSKLYYRNPEAVEAFRLGHRQVPAWFMRAVDLGQISLWLNGLDCVIFRTSLWNIFKGFTGDYVIKNQAGEIYPRGADIFEANYMEAK